MTEAQEVQSEVKEEAKVVEKPSGKLALVLIRGLVGITKKVRDTLKMLRLNRKNQCVVIENNPVNKGMVKKVKDYITWGEITDETYKKLVEKKGVEFQGRLQDRKKKYNYKTLEISGKKYKPYFSLNSPVKGFGRKGIKVPFNVGGGLGYRADKINDLIGRMI